VVRAHPTVPRHPVPPREVAGYDRESSIIARRRLNPKSGPTRVTAALPTEYDSWLKETERPSSQGNMPVDHEFGDQHTELKLSIVEKYLKFFTTALRGKFKELWYIDAFAGTGTRTVRHEERAAGLLDAGEPEKIERRRGSARIAIDVVPQFDFIVFIENKPSYFSALQELRANYPKRQIAVVKNDANAALISLIENNSWRSTRAVLFLDPYGMELEWSTLEKVAATKAIDVWFLFSLAGLYRQATKDLADVDQHKRAALTRMFGSDAWEEELYPRKVRKDLFDGVSEEPRQRAANVGGLEAYAKVRLETIFPAVLKPLPLPLRERPQRFSLFFCVSNPRAIRLASDVANHILKVGMSS
jgi:three-Cys-motif partner protein